MISPATSRTWATDPAALDSSVLCSVWTESITHTSGRSCSRVASTACRSVSAITGMRSAAPPGRRSARSRICAADSSAETYSARRPASDQVRQRHRRQRRLADPRSAADQDQRAGHDPPAEDVVELADAGAQALLLHRGDAPELDRAHRARTAARAGHPREKPPAASAPPPPACSTPRTPGTAPPTAESRARRPSRRGRWWGAASSARLRATPDATADRHGVVTCARGHLRCRQHGDDLPR